jgi:hypothetical protein
VQKILILSVVWVCYRRETLTLHYFQNESLQNTVAYVVLFLDINITRKIPFYTPMIADLILMSSSRAGLYVVGAGALLVSFPLWLFFYFLLKKTNFYHTYFTTGSLGWRIALVAGALALSFLLIQVLLAFLQRVSSTNT